MCSRSQSVDEVRCEAQSDSLFRIESGKTKVECRIFVCVSVSRQGRQMQQTGSGLVEVEVEKLVSESRKAGREEKDLSSGSRARARGEAKHAGG